VPYTVPEIVKLIGELIERGAAYAVGRDVYFRVRRFEDYGRLSGRPEPEEDTPRNPSEEEERNPLKEDPRDFALWKGHKQAEDTWWETPWGRGRPGWHIECSAMAEKYLGPRFEIHGGGLDLVFPHHENEIAQSRSAGREFARLWMHNGMLRLAGEKMSKSLGNVATLRDVLDEWGRETLLLFFLSAQWRKPIDFNEESMAAAAGRADGLGEVFRLPSEPATEGAWDRFTEALEDDFNTPDALAVMHEWRDHDLLRHALDVFGLASLAEEEEAPTEIIELAERRQAARASGDFAEADRLRERIARAGWVVRDVPAGFRLVRTPQHRQRSSPLNG